MTAIDPSSIPRSDDSDATWLSLGGVDRNLVESRIWLNAQNASALYLTPVAPTSYRTPRPWLEEIVAELTAGMVNDFQRAMALRRWVAGIPRTFPEGGASTREGFWQDFSTFLRGGTEEEVIRKGTPLAAELSRVLVTLAAVTGVSGRIVLLSSDDSKLRHTVTELYVNGHWSVFDPVSDRSFIWSKHGYASAWDIQQMPRLIDGLQDHGRLQYVESRYYQRVAIATYDPWDPRHRFPWEPLDDATRARLQRGEAG
jgi:hypothetical protein